MNISAIIFILSNLLLYPKAAPLHSVSSDASLHTIIPRDTIISRDVILQTDSGPYEKAPTVLNKVDPDYPKEALKDSLEGSVRVKVRVSAAGRVTYARIVASDNVIFNNAALKAARKWRFTPAILRGRPVDVWVTIPFHFTFKPKKSTGPISTRPDSVNPEIRRALLRLKDNKPID